MKKHEYRALPIVFIIAFVMAAVIDSNAQKVEVGLRYMPTVSSFEMKTSSGGVVTGGATLGYGIGAFLGFNFSEHVGLQGEIIYSSVTQKYKEVDVERNINLKYVNVPFLLSLNTGKTKPVNLNVVVGPQIGFSAGSSVTSTGGDGSVNSHAVVSVKKGDLGFAYGAGLDFGMNTAKTIRLGLGFRGVFGLIDISDNSQVITSDSYYVLNKTKIKTYSGYVGLSILF